MDQLCYELRPAASTHEAGWNSVSWQLGLPSGEPIYTLSHSVPSGYAGLLPENDRADHAVVALLLFAMQNGTDLLVRGKVSPRLLDGLAVLQSIWHRWRPLKYRLINIIVECEVAVQHNPNNNKGLFAFSGGVDASFTFFRHFQDTVRRVNRQPGAAMLVHGMDIPLERSDEFDGALSRSSRMLEGTGVSLMPVRTNSRQLNIDWEESFGLHLIACFLLFQKHFGFGVKASEEPYDGLLFPWGSTPMTDHLLSTESMNMVHDGADFDRTDKVDWLARNTQAASDIRVCWAGDSLDRNCGKCEKCIRTMLNFWAAGHEVPVAFPNRLSPELVMTLQPRNEIQFRELRSVYSHAVRIHGSNDKLLKSLELVMNRSANSSVKQRVKKISKRLLGHLL